MKDLPPELRDQSLTKYIFEGVFGTDVWRSLIDKDDAEDHAAETHARATRYWVGVTGSERGTSITSTHVGSDTSGVQAPHDAPQT